MTVSSYSSWLQPHSEGFIWESATITSFVGGFIWKRPFCIFVTKRTSCVLCSQCPMKDSRWPMAPQGPLQTPGGRTMAQAAKGLRDASCDCSGCESLGGGRGRGYYTQVNVIRMLTCISAGHLQYISIFGLSSWSWQRTAHLNYTKDFSGLLLYNITKSWRWVEVWMFSKNVSTIYFSLYIFL